MSSGGHSHRSAGRPGHGRQSSGCVGTIGQPTAGDELLGVLQRGGNTQLPGDRGLLRSGSWRHTARSTCRPVGGAEPCDGSRQPRQPGISVLGLSSLSFTITEADVNATNTVQGTENTLPVPVNVTVPLTANQSATFQLPSAPATVGPWTAASSGTINFTPGNVDESLPPHVAHHLYADIGTRARQHRHSLTNPAPH